MATNQPVLLHLALDTQPQAPLPITLISSYFVCISYLRAFLAPNLSFSSFISVGVISSIVNSFDNSSSYCFSASYAYLICDFYILTGGAFTNIFGCFSVLELYLNEFCFITGFITTFFTDLRLSKASFATLLRISSEKLV